ncbi:HXXEE domain-containing protein [Nocardioides hankookensis]|uniref:HXXEE domain-containing protein n=1 Tax=Nocardioides hankookensis TaxID=443157 RepID=A0ABW1LJ76_9ACTN
MRSLYATWPRVGMVLAAVLTVALVVALADDPDRATDVRFVLAVSLLTLFLHQNEEYVRPGGFPRMVNLVMFHSDLPDRYPLDQRTSWIVNVGLGWTSYAAAAIVGAHAIWLGIATLVVSAGNVFAHTLLFNIRGRTLYNPGLATCWLLFVPVITWFVVVVARDDLVGVGAVVVGIALGLALNYLGVVRLIVALGDRDSPYAFPARR